MEYPHAEAFLNFSNTINDTLIFEPNEKDLLKKTVFLPCHYHSYFKKKLENWKSHGNTLP